EGDGLRVLARVARAFLFGGGGEAVGIDDGGAALALADAAACCERLPKGQPRLRRPALFDHRAPQDEDIDAAVGTASQRITRQAGRGGGGAFGAPPRLDPWEAASFELGDDTAGNLVVEIGAGRTVPFAGCAALAGLAHGCPPYLAQNPMGLPRS